MNTTVDEALPEVVSHEQWTAAIEAFRRKDKAQTRQRDALNAERRRLPMERIEKHYLFKGAEGEVSLLDLFEGRSQLIVYHFMFGPQKEVGCTGCSMMVDNMGHSAHLQARGVSRVLISRAPYEKLAAFKARMGWDTPWYSSFESDFNRDFGVTSDNGEMFGLSVFLRDGENIFRTYFTTLRGAEYLGSNFSYLDLTPFGRQEVWEDTPAGRPQSAPYEWWHLHDEYGSEVPGEGA